MRIILLDFLLIIILCSCGRESTYETANTDSVLVIDLLSEPEAKVTKLSEIASDVEYIPLQTSDNSLIGDIVNKIVTIGNRIYVNCGVEILCFDTDGKFYYKINELGRGPEEYLSLVDFDISSDNTLLTILSSLDSRLLLYGISEAGFTFRSSVSLKKPAPWRMNMVPETDKLFLAIPTFSGGAEPTLSLLINTHGDTLHFKPNCYKFEVIRSTHSRSSTDMIVYPIENMVCFKELFSDTVFYVDAKDNLFKPRMIFDTHGTLYTPEMRGGSQEIEKNTTGINNIFETSRYVVYWYWYATQETLYNIILFDKKTKTKYNLDIGTFNVTIANIPRYTYMIKLKDDLCGGPDFNQRINDLYSHCSGGKLFSFVEAFELKEYVAGEDFKNAKVTDRKKNELIKLADSLKETDNPVLVVVTPKE